MSYSSNYDPIEEQMVSAILGDPLCVLKNTVPKKKEKSPMMSQAELDAMTRRLAEAQLELNRRADLSAGVGSEPEPYSVVVFSKKFSRTDRAREYTYAAIRIGDKWYITQSSQYTIKSPMTWEELLEFTGLFDDRCLLFVVASEWDVKIEQGE